MNTNIKLAAFAVLAIGVVVAGILLGRSPKPTFPEPPTETAQPVQSGDPGSTRIGSPVRTAPAPTPPATNPPLAMPATNPPALVIYTNWEEQIEDLLHLEVEDKEIGRRLLALLPRLPVDGQVDAVLHAINLLPDEEYADLSKLLNDDQQSEEVLEELFMDLLNRKQSVMMPELLQIAKNEKHPHAEEAKEFLELYLENDYGKDWSLWEKKLKEWLAANPD